MISNILYNLHSLHEKQLCIRDIKNAVICVNVILKFTTQSCLKLISNEMLRSEFRVKFMFLSITFSNV